MVGFDVVDDEQGPALSFSICLSGPIKRTSLRSRAYVLSEHAQASREFNNVK